MGVMSKPTLALASAGGVLVFLGLAILGWGGFDAFFANPARIALVVATAAMVVAASFSSANLSAGEREDRSNRWIIGALGLIGLLSAWLPAYTDRKAFWVLDGDAVRWLGVALYAAGGALRLWPVFVLDRRFSGLVAIQSGHTLVTGGIYSVIRNPSYVGLLVLSLGWALAFRSGIGVLLAALNIPPIVARIRSEEKLLRAHFGEEYEAYCARTWRLIPGLY
jgi:protein-S-isoprenylcysteine O-methyltransferase Ste14